MHIQDLAGVAHDAIDPSVFSISGDEQMVRCPRNCVQNIVIRPLWPHNASDV